MATQEEIDRRIAESTKKFKERRKQIEEKRQQVKDLNAWMEDNDVRICTWSLANGGAITVGVFRTEYYDDRADRYPYAFDCACSFKSPKDDFNINRAKSIIKRRFEEANYRIFLKTPSIKQASRLFRLQLLRAVVHQENHIPRWLSYEDALEVLQDSPPKWEFTQ